LRAFVLWTHFSKGKNFTYFTLSCTFVRRTWHPAEGAGNLQICSLNPSRASQGHSGVRVEDQVETGAHVAPYPRDGVP
jgi:hypothetical protein